MIRTEIKNMPAGEEMDKLIAEVLNLYTKKARPGDWGNYNSYVRPFSTDDMTVRYVRPFSTDIASAWDVVNQLSARGWNVQVEKHETYCTCTLWLRDRAMPTKTNSVGVTAEYAICLAALLAMDKPDWVSPEVCQ
jgi:hypothetical protein